MLFLIIAAIVAGFAGGYVFVDAQNKNKDRAMWKEQQIANSELERANSELERANKRIKILTAELSKKKQREFDSAFDTFFDKQKTIECLQKRNAQLEVAVWDLKSIKTLYDNQKKTIKDLNKLTKVLQTTNSDLIVQNHNLTQENNKIKAMKVQILLDEMEK